MTAPSRAPAVGGDDSRFGGLGGWHGGFDSFYGFGGGGDRFGGGGFGGFAARPSGTEEVYKIYAVSFKDEAHLNEIVSEGQEIVNKALADR